MITSTKIRLNIAKKTVFALIVKVCLLKFILPESKSKPPGNLI